MRSTVRVVLLVTGFILASSFFAHADLITLSISEQASGTLGDTTFTNQLLTFTGSFTTEQLAACSLPDAFEACTNPYYAGDPNYFIDSLDGLVTRISVSGLGTFEGTNLDYFVFLYSGSLSDIVVQGAGDSAGRFGVPTDPIYLGQSCSNYLPSPYCPIRAFTSGGDLFLTSVGDTYSTSVVITDTSAVPEPETLALLTTGLLGAAGLLRRRAG
jgi:PEP-CTERM motif